MIKIYNIQRLYNASEDEAYSSLVHSDLVEYGTLLCNLRQESYIGYTDAVGDEVVHRILEDESL